MRKTLRIIALLVAVVLVSGCYKIETNMGINKDKSVDFEMTYAVDKNIMDTMGEYSDDDESSSMEINPEDFKELEEKGYKVTVYSKDDGEHNYQGVTISKKYDSIDDLLTDSDKRTNMIEDQEDIPTALFKKDGNKYVSVMDYDFSEDSDSSMVDSEQLDEMLDLSYKVTLPTKVISTNADKVSDDGKTLTWDLKYGKNNQIEYEFEFDKKTIITDFNKKNKTIIIAVIAAVVVIAIGFCITKKKN